MVMKFIVFLAFLFLFTVSCNDNPSNNNNNNGNENTCQNECANENEKICKDNALMVCKKQDGCLKLIKLENCTGICQNGECKEEDKNCDPICKEWQVCNNSVCELKAGKCETNSDCSDNQECISHTCIDKNNKTVKKKIVVGSGGKVKSDNYKLKLNVGKVSTTSTVKSNNFKIKLGNSSVKKSDSK